MGVVYQAVDPILQRAVAIKVLREGIAARPESVRKFLREVRTAARLNHPHVVAVYDADQEKGIVYLVMELMEGGSAHDRIHKWGPFDWVEATQVMADACRGLAAVHAAGLIHRDIKPSNVMRAHDGQVKLADFGLALTIDPSDSPGAGTEKRGGRHADLHEPRTMSSAENRFGAPTFTPWAHLFHVAYGQCAVRRQKPDGNHAWTRQSSHTECMRDQLQHSGGWPPI